MLRPTIKKLLLSLMAIGVLASLTVGGTYAVFKSEETNAANSVATGTLTFNDSVNSGTACLSWGAGASNNIQASCTNPLVTSSTLYYPGTLLTVSINIKDDGSLPINTLDLYLPNGTASPAGPGCTQGTSPSATVIGGGNPCATNGLEMYVQETNSGGTATQCWYPTVAAGACSLSASTLYSFSQAYPNLSAALNLGAGPVAQGTRYFVIGLEIPNTAGAATQALQGESASFPLIWYASSCSGASSC